MAITEKVPLTELNGKTVPVERRKEVRIAKDGGDGEQSARAVTYKIAVKKEEIERAFTLVWDNYVEAGLQQDDHQGIRFTKYHFLPETRIFIANFHEELEAKTPQNFRDSDKVVGTVSIVFDSPMGLPMEEFCGDQIEKIRAEGGKVAEVTAFALNPEYTKYKVFLHMFKLLFQFAELKGVTDLCCSVAERHCRFYQKICLFEPLGELVPYSAAYIRKVQGHRLNISKANEKAQAFYSGREFDADLHRFFFTENYNRKKGEGRPLSNELLHYFLAERTDYIHSLDEKDLLLLRDEYERVGQAFPF
ncbi:MULTISPECIES: N-acyl amino acid synthase FeeM domain-containing protein [Vibrio]|uniref:N-acyl amino acid synthase FeeM catalytic core domain-containing protein n=2 Tax=Vibrio TaxID=662 RepID=A0A7X4LQC9_9VIBR|nr:MULTISPECIES: hypothetical protein [Vibrio]MBF9002132.1 hypothetical protein [Vibrio nitrifigilis]MZI96109.1 hypothetical protein [Vibrio eleionomae]